MSRPLIVLSGSKTPAALSAFEQAVVDRCCAEGCDCLLIPHLYHLPESSAVWRKLAGRTTNAVLFCWLHPRAAQGILRRHDVDAASLTIVNLAGFDDGDAAARAVLSDAGGTTASPGKVARIAGRTRERWYPVLDASRCVQCGHCLQFCLFGVYEWDAEGRVAVRNPDQCKPGCPACSRICPQGAIMFPLYEKDPAIAGAPGQFVTIDADARKMFYARTGQLCPVCGRKHEPSSRAKKAKGEPCPECGQPQDEPVPPLPFDDLDDLVDRLDRQIQRRS